jgi:hypothetical protein
MKPRQLVLGGVMMTAWACGAPSAGQPAASSAASEPAATTALDDDLLVHWIEPLGARALTARERAKRELARSRALWTALVVRQGGEYAYLRTLRLGPKEVQNAVVRVRGNQVIERTCERWGAQGRLEHSTEDGARIGSEPNCHAAETVEQLYARCAALLERAPGDVLFELHDNGILAACALPAAACGPTSKDCVTLRWAWEPRHERPCLGGPNVHRHGTTFPYGCNECTCLNGMEGCTDGGPERCL